MVENYTKDIKESVYHGAVINALAVGYTMLGKTLIKMSPPSLRCMIKIFWGGRGGDTFKTPFPYEQLLPLPTPYFKMFLERSLNDPPPPATPLQASFTATPPPQSTTHFPP